MRIYLASRYCRRGEMKLVASALAELGHTITSRWLNTEWVNRPNESSAAPPEYRQQYAMIDLEDIDSSDCVISFTESPRDGSRGGRHVEFGYALAKGKRMIVVGYQENLFHNHPQVEFFSTVNEMLETLSKEKVA